MAAIKIISEEILSDKHSTLKSIRFAIQKRDGNWETQEREVYERGNAVTALLYNNEKKTILLTKQFRLASHINGNKGGMLTEACAGLLEAGEEPEAAMKRELEEETGYAITDLKKVGEAYMSPGAYTEKIYFFLAAYTPEQKVAEGGGLEEEGEDIQLLELSFDEAINQLRTGAIKDGKTILLLQHALLNGIIR